MHHRAQTDATRHVQLMQHRAFSGRFSYSVMVVPITDSGSWPELLRIAHRHASKKALMHRAPFQNLFFFAGSALAAFTVSPARRPAHGYTSHESSGKQLSESTRYEIPQKSSKIFVFNACIWDCGACEEQCQ